MPDTVKEFEVPGSEALKKRKWVTVEVQLLPLILNKLNNYWWSDSFTDTWVRIQVTTVLLNDRPKLVFLLLFLSPVHLSVCL